LLRLRQHALRVRRMCCLRPTDADIERASLAVYAEDCIRRNVDEEPWRLAARWRDVLDEPERERYRRMAQAAAKAFRRSR
jgi:hypothetical protein